MYLSYGMGAQRGQVFTPGHTAGRRQAMMISTCQGVLGGAITLKAHCVSAQAGGTLHFLSMGLCPQNPATYF